MLNKIFLQLVSLTAKGKSYASGLLLFLLLMLFGSNVKIVSALEENQNKLFSTNLQVNYQIDEDGTTKAVNTITITNLTSELYVPLFTFNLKSITAENIKAFENGSELDLEIKQEGKNTQIKVNFDKAVAGKNKKRAFEIHYIEKGFAKKTGDIWEILIPKLADENSFDNYSITLSVPSSFGSESYISPKPIKTEKEKDKKIYFYEKESIGSNGISAGFGQYQIYSFSISYHLENPLNKESSIGIAIPPDTSTQTISYDLISPEPENITIDQDGNWIAEYKLAKRERLDVEVKGDAKIFSKPRNFLSPSYESLNKNLESTKYWQTNNKDIKKLADELRTPKNIYDFVVKTLNYDTTRVKPNAKRMGSVLALNNPNNAICMEFTDLFIAISRAAGIPAREINGYAYTENPDIQPLSLVADVLHAWPEYWDINKKTWIPIDPTWASTSGTNFFDNLDLRHFAFVIHGKDPETPYTPGSYKLGENPQKDVFVSFGQKAKDDIAKTELKIDKNSKLLFLSNIKFTLKNTGKIAIYDIKPKVYFDNTLAETSTIKALPPYAYYQQSINIPFNLFEKNAPSKIRIVVHNQEVDIDTNKNLILARSAAILAVFVTVIFIAILKIIRIVNRRKMKRYEFY